MTLCTSTVEAVRRSTRWVADNSSLVTIDYQALENEIKTNFKDYGKDIVPTDWAQENHFFDAMNPDLTVQYIFVLDCLNFCFWPAEEYEYEHLAGNLKKVFQTHPEKITGECLSRIDEKWISQWLAADDVDLQVPLLAERARLVRELGSVLATHFQGKASNLVKAAECSAVRLVDLLCQYLPGFRDHSIYKGHQIVFCKRAQILAADLWGAFKGKSYGQFHDISSLTCFADYRIPQLLNSLEILKYARPLQEQITQKETIDAGSHAEIEIRAATVQAVEIMKQKLCSVNIDHHSIQLDWILWGRGEQLRHNLLPHHRTLTIFY